jgi:hypothetical protein
MGRQHSKAINYRRPVVGNGFARDDRRWIYKTYAKSVDATQYRGSVQFSPNKESDASQL